MQKQFPFFSWQKFVPSISFSFRTVILTVHKKFNKTMSVIAPKKWKPMLGNTRSTLALWCLLFKKMNLHCRVCATVYLRENLLSKLKAVNGSNKSAIHPRPTPDQTPVSKLSTEWFLIFFSKWHKQVQECPGVHKSCALEYAELFPLQIYSSLWHFQLPWDASARF